MQAPTQSGAQATAFTVRRPWPIRSLVFTGRMLDKCGLKQADLSEDSVIAAAEKRTGLYDWGPEPFQEPLRLILQDFQNDPNRGFVGRFSGRQRTINLLCNRLLIQDDLKRFPETTSLPVERPIFVLGFPRSGTSVLHNLLAQDPANRAPRMWETVQPAVPARQLERSPNLRQRRVKRFLRFLDYVAPQLKTLHPIDPEGPEECLPLLVNSLITPLFAYNGPLYRDWLLTAPPDVFLDCYRYYKKQIQILQRQEMRERWALKCPGHLFAMDALLRTFPDACIIQTHRDPYKLIPSGCSLAMIFEGILCERTDVHSVAARYLQLSDETLRRAMTARDKINPDRVYDLQFHDLMNDPAGELRNAYAHFGLPFTSEHEAGIHDWLARNPRDKHGKHKYTLEQFGLERQQVDALFADYRDRFQVPREK